MHPAALHFLRSALLQDIFPFESEDSSALLQMEKHFPPTDNSRTRVSSQASVYWQIPDSSQVFYLGPSSVFSPRECLLYRWKHCTFPVHVPRGCVLHRSETNNLRWHCLQKIVSNVPSDRTHNYNHRSPHPPILTDQEIVQTDIHENLLPVFQLIPVSASFAFPTCHKLHHSPDQNDLSHKDKHPDCILSPHKSRSSLSQSM